MATYVNSVSGQELAPERTGRLPWKWLAWFGALLLAGYAPVLYYLALDWYGNEDMGHGFFVLPIAAFIVWQRRAKLSSIQPRPSNWGLVLCIWAAIQFTLGTVGAEIFLARTSFILAIAGAVLYIGGWRILKTVAFPLFLLFFMIPLPAIIYARLTLQLQLAASHMAEVLLGVLGIPVLRDGNVLELASQKLSVVEACSGIRSLLALSFLSLVYAHFFDRKTWMRWVLLAATIPIAIAANAARITLTGVLSEIRTDLAQGFFHSLEGLVLFFVSLALLVLVHRLINWAYGVRYAKRTATA